MADQERLLRIQVCYAEPQRQVLRELGMRTGATIADAISCSGLEAYVPADELAACRVGIWGKLKAPETPLQDLDRVEIYRPLLADPKDARRRRADKKMRSKRQ